MPYRISSANSADAYEIASLLKRSIVELCGADHGGDPVKYADWVKNKTPENVERMIDGPGAFLAASDMHGKVLGVAMGTPEGEVVLNYVLPEARFSGISRGLMQALERYFKDCLHEEARLKSTGTAERFYRSLGYEETGEVDTRQGMTFRGFRKRILDDEVVRRSSETSLAATC